MKKILPIALLFMLCLMGCVSSSEESPINKDDLPTMHTAPISTPKPEESTSPVEPLSANNTRELTQEEIETFFTNAYDVGKICAEYGGTQDEVLEAELNELRSKQELNSDYLDFPEDYEVQYLKWRLLNTDEAPAQTGSQEAPAVTENKPSGNTQPAGNTQPSGNTQPAPSTPTIVDDSGNPIQASGVGEYTPDSGGRIDADNVETAIEQGYLPSDPSNIIYGD